MTKLEDYNPDELRISPWRSSLAVSCLRVTSNTTFKLNDGVMLNSVHVYDRQAKTNLYQSKDISDILLLLSPTALRLFILIAQRLPHNQDYIQINKEYYYKRLGLKSSITWRAAIKELMRYQIILATHYNTVYWVNPAIIFNGDRAKFYPECIKVVSEL